MVASLASSAIPLKHTASLRLVTVRTVVQRPSAVLGDGRSPSSSQLFVNNVTAAQRDSLAVALILTLRDEAKGHFSGVTVSG